MFFSFIYIHLYIHNLYIFLLFLFQALQALHNMNSTHLLDDLMRDLDWNKFLSNLQTVILQSICMILGIIGNIHTILVYWLYYKKNNLRNFVLTLSSVDLFMCCIVLPQWIYEHRFYNHNIYVCISLKFIPSFSGLFSYSLLAVIAINRVRVIVKPLGRHLTYLQSKIVCFMTGLFSFLFCCPKLFTYSIQETFHHFSSYNITWKECILTDEQLLMGNVYTVVIYEGLCILICVVAYTLLCGYLWMLSKGNSLTTQSGQRFLGLTMCCRNSSTNSTENFNINQHDAKNPRRKHFIKGMRTSRVFLVISFLSCLCAIPNFVFNILELININMLNQWKYFIGSTLLTFLNSIIYVNFILNPIVYFIIDTKYRSKLKVLYQNKCNKCFRKDE